MVPNWSEVKQPQVPSTTQDRLFDYAFDEETVKARSSTLRVWMTLLTLPRTASGQFLYSIVERSLVHGSVVRVFIGVWRGWRDRWWSTVVT